jgi:hypothetical protein
MPLSWEIIPWPGYLDRDYPEQQPSQGCAFAELEIRQDDELQRVVSCGFH